MNPYLNFVKDIERGVETAKTIQVAGIREPHASDDVVLLFSPHPDDECITGLLPYRLGRELGASVVNVPVTFGSNVDRQAGRARELADACGYLGWEIAREDGEFGNLEIDDIVEILESVRPKVIFFPHERDWNSRHIATHHLVMEALAKTAADFSCVVVETEFWGAMDDPNLMVAADAEAVAELVAATALHVEEVARNPYHLSLPAWMIDNTRRGGELVGGQGAEVPDMLFSTLYRLGEWKNGALTRGFEKGRVVELGAENLKELF